MATVINTSNYTDPKTLDMLAVTALLLFAALLFVSFTLPVLKSHTLYSRSVIQTEITGE